MEISVSVVLEQLLFCGILYSLSICSQLVGMTKSIISIDVLAFLVLVCLEHYKKSGDAVAHIKV
jgi:hypothetical protein